ncbi:Zinc transporter 6 [Takifugu flavidus]|uniref:Zinc transporter 6 n=1 Tax=Takifugu flavidus TaxID=433684 RepID=A0A5C6PEK8_9TELE|nr:Zinc transporter 6 [Takifugu flavidus]
MDVNALTAYTYLTIFDLFSLITCLISYWVTMKKPTQLFSFGFERLEVLAVFASTVLVQLGALFILKERGRTKSMGCRLGEWVEQSRNVEPRGKDVNPWNRAVPLTAGSSDRKGLTGDEADNVAEQTGDEQQRSRGQAEKSKPGEQTGTRNAEAEVVVRGRKQVSGDELMGWEWLAGRVEQRQGRVENY